MTMTLVKLSYHSKLLHDPGLVQQTPLCISSFQKDDITIRFWYLHLRQMSWSEFAKFCLFVCFESWKFNVNLKIHFKHGPWELNSHFKMYPPENSSSFNQKKQISTFTTKRSKTLVGTFKTTVELVREFYFSGIICLQ